jgi:hypothetical protein
MATKMTHTARAELTQIVHHRYCAATGADKHKILEAEDSRIIAVPPDRRNIAHGSLSGLTFKSSRPQSATVPAKAWASYSWFSAAIVAQPLRSAAADAT